MNKEDYLRKKGVLPTEDLGKMYFAYFNKDEKEVKSFEAVIWEKRTFNYFSFDKGKTSEHQGERFSFKEAPFEIDFFEGCNAGKKKGLASGFGDLLRWCYFGFLDEKQRDDKYQELLEESKNWDKPQEIIMPQG